MARQSRSPIETCPHPRSRQSTDFCTNEQLCERCGYLRDIMPWAEWDVAHKKCKNCTAEIETMDTVEYDGQTWQVSAITEDGYELIGYADVHDYVDFADVAQLKLVEKG